ncbi:MFS polyamine transporter [Lanmaoa asiatica]|nr:MFS polyamine transporter [Lanmaoa asiatica]
MDALRNIRDHPSSANTSEERRGGVSLRTKLHGNHPLDISGVTQDSPKPISPNEEPPSDGENTSVLVVDWDGPPQNPKNWSFKQKWAATAIVFTFTTPMSSSMVAPATNQVAAQFGIHSSVVVAFTTSIFVLAYGKSSFFQCFGFVSDLKWVAVGPLFFGPLSEIYGRSRVLQLANLWFLAWNLACGFAQNESQLLAFRFLAGLGGSAPLAIGGGVLGDCWRTEERGQAVAVYTLAPLLGPVVGPLAGAWVAECSTWRWVFWSTSIVDVAIQALGLFYLQETYPPLLLERKAEKIRRSMDVEKAPHREVRTIFGGTQDRSWQVIMTKSLVRPFALFVQEPIIQLLGVYMAYLHGLMFLFLTTIPSIFEGVYRQSVGISGLHYIALGFGLLGALQLNARTLDRVYVYLKNKNGGVGKPEFRLPVMFVGTLVLPIGLLIAGWTVQARTHWIAPDIGIVLIGAGVMLNFQCIQTYVVDTFTLYAASGAFTRNTSAFCYLLTLLTWVGTAMAAVSCLRTLAGCGFPLFAPAMYSAPGFGKGDTVLAVIAIVIGWPAQVVLFSGDTLN